MWVAESILGALFGRLIPDPHAFGIDFLLPIYFLGLIMGFRKRCNWLPVVLANGSASIAVYYTIGSPWHVSLGAIVGVWSSPRRKTTCTRRKPRRKRRELWISCAIFRPSPGSSLPERPQPTRRVSAGISCCRASIPIPPRVNTALDAVPAAVLTTLVAPALVSQGWAEALTLVVTAAVAMRFNLAVTLIAGGAAIIALRALSG